MTPSPTETPSLTEASSSSATPVSPSSSPSFTEFTETPFRFSSLESSFAPYVNSLYTALKKHLQKATFQKGVLGNSMYYTACEVPGKGLRPLLSLVTAEALGVPEKKVLPFAISLELVHSYSLIHDDLPCMDDDVERRGQKCNHLVFGEGIALLAGNGLLLEAFSLLVSSYSGGELPRLLGLLLEATGTKGMILGQAMDLSDSEGLPTSSVSPSSPSSDSSSSFACSSEGKEDPLSSFQKMVFLKTGALFQAACLGGAFLAQANADIIAGLKAYARCLGMAFQAADDLLDKGKYEKQSFHTLLGEEATEKRLKGWSSEAIDHLEVLEKKHSLSLVKLKQILGYNMLRIRQLKE